MLFSIRSTVADYSSGTTVSCYCRKIGEVRHNPFTSANAKFTGKVLVEVHILNNGYFVADRSVFVWGKDWGVEYRAASKPMLILTEKEKILVDPGADEAPSDTSHPPFVTPEEKIEAQLASYKLKPSDITLIVNSHLHWNHSHNNRFFKNAKIIVQRDELRYSFCPDTFWTYGPGRSSSMRASPYSRESVSMNVDWHTIKGDYNLTDNVRLLSTPGHTVGHMSTVVLHGESNMVYAADVFPLRDNFDEKRLPGQFVNAFAAWESMEKLWSINSALYIFGHDREQDQLKPQST